MPEVSSLFNGVQIGAETTPGTSVSAGKVLNYLNFQPTFWAGDFNVMRPLGQKVGSGVAPGSSCARAAGTSAITTANIARSTARFPRHETKHVSMRQISDLTGPVRPL